MAGVKRKLHICVDLITREILSVVLTGNDEDDASVESGMLEGKPENLTGFKGDGGYDKFGFREVLGDKLRQVIPPSKNGVVTLSKRGNWFPNILYSAIRR